MARRERRNGLCVLTYRGFAPKFPRDRVGLVSQPAVVPEIKRKENQIYG